MVKFLLCVFLVGCVAEPLTYNYTDMSQTDTLQGCYPVCQPDMFKVDMVCEHYTFESCDASAIGCKVCKP